jgi:hypothetical protein
MIGDLNHDENSGIHSQKGFKDPNDDHLDPHNGIYTGSSSPGFPSSNQRTNCAMGCEQGGFRGHARAAKARQV